MKRFYFIIAIVVSAIGMSAQGFEYRVEAGLNLTRDVDDTHLNPGFNIGGVAEYNFNSHWFVDAGLKFSNRTKYIYWWIDETDTVHQYGLMLPIHAGYKFKVSNNVKLWASLGGYAGLGLYSNITSTYKPDETGNLYGKGLRRYEVGLSGVIGAEYKKHYTMSLGADMQTNDPLNYNYPTIPNALMALNQLWTFSINIGYKF